MNPDDFIKAVLGFGTGLGAAAFGYQRYAVAQSKKDLLIAGDDASIAQMISIKASIEASKIEAAEFRAQLAIFDRKLHQQQRTITRMEMLLRQFSGLVREHGIAVPEYMQKELEELIESDVDRTSPPSAEPRAFP